MPQTIGYHLVKSCYGLWLPGDERGHWSDKWDEELGFIEPHMLHPGDPVRKRMAEERMKYPPVHMTPVMVSAVADALKQCVNRSHGGLRIVAATIEPTHMHLLIPYSGRDIHKTAKWIADQTTKAVRETTHLHPLWCKGKWCSFVFDRSYWRNIKAYIERHNHRRGLSGAPYPFIDASV